MSILLTFARLPGFVSRKTRSYTEDIKLGGRRAARWIVRTGKNVPVNNRNSIRRRCFMTCMDAVNEANPHMPRKERRSLARAYANAEWKTFSKPAEV